MTQIVPGVVEVYVIRHNAGDWRVLVLQRAPDVSRPGSWEIVYGKIDSGERPEQAAVRELREETGLDLSALYDVTVSSFSFTPLRPFRWPSSSPRSSRAIRKFFSAMSTSDSSGSLWMKRAIVSRGLALPTC